MLESLRSKRHDELAKFLLSRRTGLAPESCGLLPPRRRRRTPGLRRDEVSALAGISTAYYTWIEQGRKFEVSSGILEAIAGALRLSDAESEHLFKLAGKTTPRASAIAPSEKRESGALARFASSFAAGPALVLTAWLDVTDANRSAREELGLVPGSNLAEALLCGAPGVRVRNVDALAGSFSALLLRSHALDIENERFDEIASRLCVRNARFRALWEARAVEASTFLQIDIEFEGAAPRRFEGPIVADPIAGGQFGLFLHRSQPGAQR